MADTDDLMLAQCGETDLHPRHTDYDAGTWCPGLDHNPLTVSCPDCYAPEGTPCHTRNPNPHATRRDRARLAAAETGTCTLCARPLYRLRLPDDALHGPDHTDCPPLPNPAVDWNAYATALQALTDTGGAPGHPGVGNWEPVCTHPNVPPVAEWAAIDSAWWCEDCRTEVPREDTP